MKRVAIIGADFVPSSLPPATRIRFFANHLPEFGWQPVIITTDPSYYDWEFDSENQQLLPTSLDVIRTRAWKTSWTRKVGIGDVGMRSLWYHWRELKRLCQKGSIDLVLIPVPPSVPMILGRLAQLRFGVPYVIDYIDPWVSEYYWSVPRKDRPPKWPLAYAMARTLEPFAIKRAGHITGVSQGTTDSVVSRYAHLTSDDATEIPYGAEPSDFEYLRNHPRQNSVFNKRDGCFHVGYVGACIPGMHPTVRALFKALNLGLQTEPELFKRLRLHFVGTSYAANGADARVSQIADEMGLEQFVDERTVRVPYLESLQIMLDSRALLLVGSDEPHYTASKVFPSLLARKPLLTIFHEESSVNDIVRKRKHSFIVNYNSTSSPESKVTDIQTALRNLLTTQAVVSEDMEFDESSFLSARQMTARLVGAFERALAKSKQTQTLKTLSESVSK